MRPLYLLLKFVLKITLWIYYPRMRFLNTSRRRKARTIYMCNHSASFMDPLIIAEPQYPLVYFMTRGDIYKGIVVPLFWGAQMLPIYRQHDKGNTAKKNEKVFRKTNRLLRKGYSLLVFAEGFTDDVFIRRLKPVKKGSVRMGFDALEAIGWKEKIYIQAVGINYSNPNTIGSDCLVSNGNPVCLNTYRKQYEKEPNKVINELTFMMEQDMRNQITDVRNEELAPFHENIMRLTRKGMAPIDSNKEIPLIERWKYSKNLANWMNSQNAAENEELMSLKERLENYFKEQEKQRIEETPLYTVLANRRRKRLDIIYLITLFLFVPLAYLFTYPPVLWIKNFVEKSFKRQVFWGSVKMLVGAAAVAGYNIVLLLTISLLFHVSFWLLLLIGLIFVPVIFVISLNWKKKFKYHRQMNEITAKDVSELAYERTMILKEIHRLIPEA